MYRLIKYSIIGWSIFCLYGVIAGMVSLGTGPRPTDEAGQAGAAIGAAIGLTMWAILWFVPVTGLGILALLIRPRSRNSSQSELAKPNLCADCGKYYVGSQNFCPNCGTAETLPAWAAGGSPFQNHSQNSSGMLSPIRSISARDRKEMYTTVR